MTQHIGIVACSAPGAALCYETICVEAERRLGGHHNPEISLHMFDLAEHVRFLEQDDWNGIADLMIRSVRKVAASGADFAICPDNTIHAAMEKVIPSSPIPWLHIAEVVAQEAKNRNFKRVGLLGTRYLMEGPVYPEKLAPAGVEWRLPAPDDRERVNGLIFDDLVYGRVTKEAEAEFVRIIETFKSREHCDAVVLGCTEIPLVVSDEKSPLPTLDSTRLLARAALKRAAGKR